MDNFIINGVEVDEVKGIDIERLYSVYQKAVEEAPGFWRENCFVDCETDYKPLQVLLCISRDEDDCWYYLDLPYSWQNGCSERMYFATKIDLLEHSHNPFNPENIEGYPYDENGEPYEGVTQEDLDAWEDWEEKCKEEEANNLEFRSFEDIVQELLG